MTTKAQQQYADLLKPTRKGRFQVAPKEQRTVDGLVFDSKRESARYAKLKLEERAGLISHLELQPSWIVYINGKKLCRFRADFSYFRNGVMVIEDTKSSGTAKDPAYRLRKKAAELAYIIQVTEVLS